MQIAIPFDTQFAPAAIRMMNWIAELSGRLDRDCVLVVTRDIESNALETALAAAHRAFCGIAVIKATGKPTHKWPETPNLLFRAMARYAEKMGKKPFFWMEVDCVPLKPEWADLLENEYEIKGKPYMGFRRDIPVPHISGPAVYPHNVAAYNGSSLGNHYNSHGPLPFDVVDGHLTLRHAAITSLIQHEWGAKDKPPTFPDKASLKIIHNEAVVFHRVKDGSLIDRLREANRPKPVSKIQMVIEGIKDLIGTRQPQPSLAMCYVHVPGDGQHREYAQKFIRGYAANPPHYKHRTIILNQGREPDEWSRRAFSILPEVSHYVHDDTGWDIGAFIAVSKQIKDDIQLCFGGSSEVRRSGWMKRMVEAWQKHGPGFYGSNATYEVSPHINTCGFWCPPRLLAQYPIRVITRGQRYDFEHGPNACWKMAHKTGLPVKLVTWDGEYDWPDWRKPVNLFRRGNQANCITRWHHHDKYDNSPESVKKAMERNSDTLTDPVYLKQLQNAAVTEEIEIDSLIHFRNQHSFGVPREGDPQKLELSRSADGVKK